MTADNPEKLSAKAQFRALLHKLMAKHDKKPRDIYHHTKHKYKFIKSTLTTDVNHRFDTGDVLMEKFGYKVIIVLVPIPNAKNLEH